MQQVIFSYFNFSLKFNIVSQLYSPTSSNMCLTAFCDSDCAACPLTRGSLFGYMVFLRKSPISLNTKKKKYIVARSSADVEYRSMVVFVCELEWLKQVSFSLGVLHRKPTRLFCDSQLALHIAKTIVLMIVLNMLRWNVISFVMSWSMHGNVSTSYVCTGNQLVDILTTKALAHSQYQFLLCKLGICD